MSIPIVLKAKTDVKHEGKSYGEHSAEKELNQPTSVSEAAQMFGDKQCLTYIVAAWKIDEQAKMRSDIIEEVLESNGIVKVGKRAMTPEERKILNGIKSLPPEKQAEVARLLGIEL